MKLVNPWPGERVQVRQVANGALLMAADGAELSFETEVGESYAVERAQKPFAEFKPAHVEGKRNVDVKMLPNTQCTLGLANSK